MCKPRLNLFNQLKIHMFNKPFFNFGVKSMNPEFIAQNEPETTG
jgi:hypothetical protein